jgi:hypothetical protein
MEDFDRARRDARPNLLAQQSVRHRVVVLVDLDVIVETDPAFFPFGKDVVGKLPFCACRWMGLSHEIEQREDRHVG